MKNTVQIQCHATAAGYSIRPSRRKGYHVVAIEGDGSGFKTAAMSFVESQGGKYVRSQGGYLVADGKIAGVFGYMKYALPNLWRFASNFVDLMKMPMKCDRCNGTGTDPEPVSTDPKAGQCYRCSGKGQHARNGSLAPLTGTEAFALFRAAEHALADHDRKTEANIQAMKDTDDALAALDEAERTEAEYRKADDTYPDGHPTLRAAHEARDKAAMAALGVTLPNTEYAKTLVLRRLLALAERHDSATGYHASVDGDRVASLIRSIRAVTYLPVPPKAPAPV